MQSNNLLCTICFSLLKGARQRACQTNILRCEGIKNVAVDSIAKLMMQTWDEINSIKVKSIKR